MSQAPVVLPPQLAVQARSLEGIGVRELAFDRMGALSVLEYLITRGVPVLGGDVYEASAGQLRHRFEGWHADRQPTESSQDYARRSADVARRYVLNYPPSTGPDVLFVIVVDGGISS